MNQTDRDAIRRVLAEADGFSFDCLEPHDYQRHVDALLALPAASAVVSPPTNRAELRDRIAEALYERERPPRDPHWPKTYASDRETFEAMADAVLAVLPEPTDRAAVLRDAIARVRKIPVQCTALTGPVWFGQGWQDAIGEFEEIAERLADEDQRRLAVEAHDTGTQQQAVALSTPCANCPHGRNWHDKGSGECLMAAPLMATCDCPAFTAPVAQQPAAEVPSGCAHRGPHPGFTCAEVDQTRPFWDGRWGETPAEQQAAAADGEQRDCAECPHPADAHQPGEDPVTPGICAACPDDDAHHDYRAARMTGAPGC